MKGPYPLITSRSALLSILFIYVLIIALVLFLSGQILRDLSIEDSPSRLIILPFALVLPIFLFVNVVINIVRLIKDNQQKKPGVTFKIKLIIFFTFVAVVSAVPQTILSVNFIETVMESWFAKGHSEAIRGGIDIALDYYNERTTTLEVAADTYLYSYIAGYIPFTPERAWKLSKESYPFLDSMQVLQEGKTVFFAGREEGAVDDSQASIEIRGLLPRENRGDESILRAQGGFRIGGNEYTVIFSSFLPSGFDFKAEKLTSSYDIFYQLENYQALFLFIILCVLLFFSVPIFLLSVIISFRLADEVIYPIVQFEEAIRRVAEGDFSFSLLARPGDNISILVHSFNQMIKELESSRKKTMHTDKINAWKEIARRMAHEIKNPLTPIKLSAERVLKRYKNKPDDPNFENILESSVRVIVTEVERLSRLLTEFSNFARMPQMIIEPADPAEIISEACNIFRQSSQKITFNLEGLSSALSEGEGERDGAFLDREKIKQVLINIISNAIDAMEGEGEIAVRTDIIFKEEKKFYRMQIADTGEGMEKDVSDQIFTPYFTTRENGTGLGLAIAERIIFDHNGTLWFETEKGVGTTFFIDLPFGGEHE